MSLPQLPNLGTPERAARFWQLMELTSGGVLDGADDLITWFEATLERSDTTDPMEAAGKHLLPDMMAWLLAANGLIVEGTLDDGEFGEKLKEGIRNADRLRKMLPQTEEAAVAAAATYE